MFRRLSFAVLLFAAPGAEASSCFGQERAGDCYLTFTIENDLFGGGTDQHYTNGWRLALYNEQQRSPEFLGFVERNLPFLDIDGSTGVQYSIGQNLYTPIDIGARTPDPTDRPFAAFLYGSIGYATEHEDHLDEMELTLGIIGPEALGEGTQDTVHKIVGATDPRGWDHQLETEPGLVISGQRSWTGIPPLTFAGLDAQLVPHAGAALGNVYTHAAAGATLHVGPSRFGLQSTPLRVQPALPGKGEFSVPGDKFAWSLFAGVEGRAVARNIFLDGNSFKSGPSVEKKTFVTDVSTGLSVTYGWLRTSYTLNWRSKEFEAQDDAQVFGAISVGVRF